MTRQVVIERHVIDFSFLEQFLREFMKGDVFTVGEYTVAFEEHPRLRKVFWNELVVFVEQTAVVAGTTKGGWESDHTIAYGGTRPMVVPGYVHVETGVRIHCVAQQLPNWVEHIGIFWALSGDDCERSFPCDP